MDSPKPTPPKPKVEAKKETPKLKKPQRTPSKKTPVKTEKPRVVKQRPQRTIKPVLAEHLMNKPFGASPVLQDLLSKMTAEKKE